MYSAVAAQINGSGARALIPAHNEHRGEWRRLRESVCLVMTQR